MTDETPRTDGAAAFAEYQAATSQLPGSHHYESPAELMGLVPLKWPIPGPASPQFNRRDWDIWCRATNRNPDTGELTADGRRDQAARERVEMIAEAARKHNVRLAIIRNRFANGDAGGNDYIKEGDRFVGEYAEAEGD